MQTKVNNLYVIQNGNSTLDTALYAEDDIISEAIDVTGSYNGGVAEVSQISILEDLHLDSSELEFNYVMSLN